MAGIGKVGSYATTDEPKDYVSDALARVEDQAFKYRAEKRLLDKEKQDKQESDENKLVESAKNFKIDLTGSRSIDDLGQGFAQESFNKFSDISRELQTTTDPNKRLKLKIEQSRLEQNISALKQIPGILKEKADFIAKNIDKLNPDAVDALQEKLGMLEKGNAKLYLDENMNPMVSIYKVGDDDEVTDVLEDNQNLASFIQGINPPLKSNYQTTLQKAVSNTAVKDITTQNGINITQKKGVDPELAKSKADSFAEMIASDRNEAYAIAKANKLDVKDIEGIKKVARKDFLESLDYLEKQDIDSALINATKPDKSPDKSTNEPASFGGFTTIKGRGNGVDINGVRVQENTRAIPITNNITIGSPGGRQERATRVLVSPGGKMYLEVERTGFETSSTTKVQANEKGKAKLKSIDPSTKKPYTIDDLLDDEKVKVTTADKNSGKVLLDFGGKSSHIAEFAKRMGYLDMDTFTRDMIAKAGGDTFFKVPQKNTSAKNTTTTKKEIKGF